MENVIRVAIYIRVSSDEQAKHGYSLGSQKERLLSYVKEKGYRLVDIYADEGKSARSKLNARKELLRLLEDVKAKKIDRIIFWRLDRWFRNIQDYYKVQEILTSNNVDWECSDEEYNTTTANGRLYLNIKLSIAQNESDQTGDRIRFNFESMIRNKKAIIGTRNCPIGYKVEGTPKNKYVVKNPDDEAFIRDLFDTFDDTMSIIKTCKFLSEKYPQYHFVYNSIRFILKNPMFYGCYKGVEDYCEPYITKEKFEENQKKIKTKIQKKKTGKTKEFLFTGLLTCPVCGRRLAANGQYRIRSTGEEYFRATYRCPKHWTDGQCSNGRVIQENMVEEWLLNNFKEYLENYIYEVEEIKEAISQTDNSSKIAKLEDKIKRLNDLYIDGYIDREKYDNDRNLYTAELNELKNKQEEVTHVDLDKLKEIINNKKALDVYKELNRSNKRAFWNSFIDRMIFIGNRDYDFTIYLK